MPYQVRTQSIRGFSSIGDGTYMVNDFILNERWDNIISELGEIFCVEWIFSPGKVVLQEKFY